MCGSEKMKYEQVGVGMLDDIAFTVRSCVRIYRYYRNSSEIDMV